MERLNAGGSALLPVAAVLGGGLAGAILRLLPPVRSDFPLNYGGFIAALVDAIADAGFTLPVFVAYNGDSLPFAYPPLALFLTALLAQAGDWSIIALLHWLPVLFALFSLPAFYYLARGFAGRGAAAAALWVYALLPGAFLQLLPGGGVTRGVALVAALLALGALPRRPGRLGWRLVVPTAVALLSHPEIGLFTLYSLATLWLLHRPRRWSGRQMAMSAGLILALTAPWWTTVVIRHGVAPLGAALAANPRDWAAIFQALLRFRVTAEWWLPVGAVLALLGGATTLARGRPALALWTAIVLLLARDRVFLASAPLALLAGEGAFYLWQAWPRPDSATRSRLWPALLALGVVLYAFAATLALVRARWYPLRSLSVAEREALVWVAENTPESSRFLLLSAPIDETNDVVGEWFPTLTGRVNAAAPWGYEWSPDTSYLARLAAYRALQRCRDADLACVTAWAPPDGRQATHLFLPGEPQPSLSGFAPCCGLLRAQLAASAHYNLLYEGPGGSVYARR